MNTRDHSLCVLSNAMSVGDLTLLMLTDRQEVVEGEREGDPSPEQEAAAAAAAGTAYKTQEVRNKRRHWQTDGEAQTP